MFNPVTVSTASSQSFLKQPMGEIAAVAILETVPN
jgi:hypothetical protein